MQALKTVFSPITINERTNFFRKPTQDITSGSVRRIVRNFQNKNLNQMIKTYKDLETQGDVLLEQKNRKKLLQKLERRIVNKIIKSKDIDSLQSLGKNFTFSLLVGNKKSFEKLFFKKKFGGKCGAEFICSDPKAIKILKCWENIMKRKYKTLFKKYLKIKKKTWHLEMNKELEDDILSLLKGDILSSRNSFFNGSLISEKNFTLS